MATESTAALLRTQGASLPRPARAGALAPHQPSQIPSLDGLRAVCILLVCAAHSVQSPVLYHWLGHLGNYGVRVFFLISGFLITTLLLKEYDRNGSVSLKHFYMRRILRIFPAFYAFVAVMILLSSAGLIRFNPGDVAHTLTYTMNYQLDPSWHLTHTWSLSVEEQFYLLWPFAFALLGPRNAMRGAAVVIVAAPLVRCAQYFGLALTAGEVPIVMGRNFQSVCDALATGCLLAGIYNWLGKSARYRNIQMNPGYLAAVVSVIAASAVTYKVSPVLYYTAGQSIANIGGVLLLDYAVRMPHSWTGLILNTGVFKAIGRISYSIYLWQELFLSSGRSPLQFHWVVSLLGIAATSLASYYAIEKPFQRLRSRFQ